VEDAVEAFLAAARLGPALSGRVVNIGGGHEITVRDLATTIVRFMGSNQKVVCLSDKVRKTEMWRSFCDNAEARELLGWRPHNDLIAGLSKTILAESRSQITAVASMKG
jgi:nucleoside-diphosphate-sugar epimerase